MGMMNTKKQDSAQSGKASVKAPQRWIRHIFEKSPVLVYVTSYDGIILDINTAGVAMLGGASREEFIGKLSIRSFYADPEDRLRFQSLVACQGFVQEYETRFQRMDKKIFDVRITGFARRNAKGEIIGYEGFIIDITDRKRAEQDLKDSEEKYRTVVENSMSAILVHQGGRIEFANQRCAEMVGVDKPEELLGRHFWEFVHPEDRAIVKDRGMMREKGNLTPEHYTFRLIGDNGKTIRWAEIRATHAMYMGKPSAVANFIDITKSKKAEYEIRHLSECLAKVREEERKLLGADLHDDVGQILTAMHFDLETLQKAIPREHSEQQLCCEKLLRNVEIIADIIRKTASYRRPDVLDTMVLIPALSRQIEEFRADHPGIRVDFTALGLKKQLNPEIELAIYRIVQESLTNTAKHAEATTVGITLTYSHPNVILMVRDNGVGRRAAGNERKMRRHPGGIGLFSMRERALSLGGTFEVSSAPGKGMTIRAQIPV